MNEIENRFEKLKLRYREIMQEELRVFDDSFPERILALQQNIVKPRKDFDCKKCGSCCKLAATPDSYDELKSKAESGDNYAAQFISVFVPYEDESVIKEIYPDYFEMLEQSGEKIHFYHCNFVTADNMCSKYEERPQICKDFPDNPIDILPKMCGFNRWQSRVLDDVLRLRAIVEISNIEKENELCLSKI